MKRFVCICCLLVIGIVSVSAQNKNPREVISLDSAWRFWLGDDPAAKQPEFDDQKWRRLDLPHDWTIELPVNPPPNGESNGGYFSHGTGWYRKNFAFSDTTKKVVLEFDGVYMNSDTWINGQFLGRKPYGFNGFRYDITEYLKRDGSQNVIAVRVDDSAEPSLRWYAGSGIYRHVHLIVTDYIHFQLNGGIYITSSEITTEKATVTAHYIIDPNFFTEDERATWAKDPWKVKPQRRALIVRTGILTLNDSLISNTESGIELESMQKGQSVSQQLTVTKPRLWSDQTPERYRLRSTLLLNGKIVDEKITLFGIRSLKFEPDHGLFVNGKPTKLKGVCIHQDAGSFGNAVPIAVWAYRLSLLKEMGCNAIRPSHHPFAPEFYDLCDQMGFYVFDEAFDEWTRDWTFNYTENTRGKAKYGYHLYFNQWHETDLREMLRRDRNHPGVILYSIGNEIPDQFNADGWKLAKELVSICHEEDSTRPVTSACDQSYVSSRNGFMDQLDIAGYNYIDRIYHDSTYQPEHRRFPHRLFLGTETTHALHNWLGVRDNDYVVGDFLWSGIDYLGEAGAFPRRGSGSGNIDIAGGKKAGFYQRAAYWRSDPVLQLFVFTGERPQNPWQNEPALLSWNWPDTCSLKVRAATNCDEVELFLNKKSLGRKAISHDFYFGDWTVAFQAGELEAIGYLNGKKVAVSKLVTAGPATKLQISPITLPIASDLSIYEITVTDKTGKRVMDATHEITIKVEGGGKLIGIDNGDLKYTGLFKTEKRNAYQGRLLVTVQKTSAMNDIRMVATAQGLSSYSTPFIESTGLRSAVR
jgi:beta-galactosidase